MKLNERLKRAGSQGGGAPSSLGVTTPKPANKKGQGSGDQEGDEPLQTGEKYLYTIGRTDQIFAKHPGELMDSCVREEDGSIKIFPIFRPKRS